MTEKQYRLNKWGTRLLKNNRPLFDWANESDEIVDLLNEIAKENEHLKIRFKEERDISMRLSKECDTLIIKKQELERKIKSMAKELCNCEEDYILEEEF